MIETIRVDLHCHSSLSDGDHSPAYVAHSLAAIGADWAALTDHNTLSGLHQFASVLDRRGVHHIVGLEMDARSPIGVLHLLGYGFDPSDQPLLDALRTIRQPWRASARYWSDRFHARRDGSSESTEQQSDVCWALLATDRLIPQRLSACSTRLEDSYSWPTHSQV